MSKYNKIHSLLQRGLRHAKEYLDNPREIIITDFALKGAAAGAVAKVAHNILQDPKARQEAHYHTGEEEMVASALAGFGVGTAVGMLLAYPRSTALFFATMAVATTVTHEKTAPMPEADMATVSLEDAARAGVQLF